MIHTRRLWFDEKSNSLVEETIPYAELFSDLPPHDFDPETDFCRHCGVPRYAVVDGIVIPQCGVRAESDSSKVV